MKTLLQAVLGGVLILLAIYAYGLATQGSGAGGPELVVRMNSDVLDVYPNKLVLVHSETCPSCLEARRFLEANGYSGRVAEVEVRSGGSEILARLGTPYVPVLVMPDQIAIGFDRGMWERAIAGAE